jgi:chromate transporter
MDDRQKSKNLTEVIKLFLRLGFTAFGGPAASISIMHDEVVKRRKWVTDQYFLDMLGATQLIPGPNSTEMAIHLGFVRARWAGLIAGGACFIIPAMLMVMALAWGYVRFGSTPQAGWISYGIKPVVIAVILQALWQLRKAALKDTVTTITGLAVLVLYFLGVHEIALLFGAGFLVAAIKNSGRVMQRFMPAALAPLAAPGLTILALKTFNLPLLFALFLKIGSILYGSGYVLLAYLRADFVTRLGWLTDRQLMDAIAVGQITPGPVFTTATFIGFILGGAKGGLLATLGIFLPSFFFVALTNPLIPRIRKSAWAGSLLDGVNVASLGLMAGVTWQLGRASLTDWLTVALSVISLVLLLKFKVNSAWLIIGGAIAGLLRA